jgi:hypothetical protein
MRIRMLQSAVMALLSAAALQPVAAQQLGIVVGGTFSQLRGLENVQTKNRSGTMFGVSLAMPVGSGLVLQPELLFINKGAELNLTGGVAQDIRLDYFEIPLLLRRNFGTGAITPHAYAGPSVGYQLGCNLSLSGNTIPKTSSDCKRDAFFEPSSVDWGAIVGAGVNLSLGGLGVTGGARYGFGLADIAKDNSAALKQRVRNGTLTVYAGLLFGRP